MTQGKHASVMPLPSTRLDPRERPGTRESTPIFFNVQASLIRSLQIREKSALLDGICGIVI